MASATDPTRHVKRKRVAKNRKKAWRKHSNIQDVEDFIDDQRMQLRTGGIVADKPNESLFFVDKNQPSQDEGASKKNLQKPLKYERKLAGDPRIPAARISKTPKSSGKRERKSRLIQRLEKEGKWGPASTAKRRKLEAALEESKQANTEKDEDDKRREVGQATYDLWGDGGPSEGTRPKRKASAVEAEPNEHFLRVTKKTRKKLPKTYYNQTSRFSAVEVVHPGASYNPSFEDHQDLFNKAIQVELDREKEEEKMRRWSSKFAKVTRAEMEKNMMNEMTQGLFDGGDDEKDEEEEKKEEEGEEEEDVVPNAPVIAERRKTRTQRNKERELKKVTQKSRDEKASKIRLNEVYRMKAIKKEIKEKEVSIEKNVKDRKAREAENEGKTGRLGRYKFEELPLPVKLPQHIQGNLRRLKPEGSMIVDRFNHLQKRNMIEPRIWKKGTKPKMKEYEKKSFKEIK